MTGRSDFSDFSAFVAPPPSGEPRAAEVDAASACLDRFTAAFNASDTSGMDAELHFPHVMLSGAQRLEWAEPGQHPHDFFEKLKATGWALTRYEKKEPVLVANDKVQFVVTYTRRGGRGAQHARQPVDRAAHRRATGNRAAFVLSAVFARPAGAGGATSRKPPPASRRCR